MSTDTHATPPTGPARQDQDRELLYQILDEALVCHLGYTVDGEPRVLPTLHARDGDTLLVHGSTGSRPMLAARPEGMPVCVAVTLLDGLVLARSQFNHTVNFRSVLIHGNARLVTDPAEKSRALDILVEHVVAGRGGDSRPPTPKELAKTAVLVVPLAGATVRARTGGPLDDPEDLDLPHWAGVVPLRTVTDEPLPDGDGDDPLPPYLHGYRRGR